MRLSQALALRGQLGLPAGERVLPPGQRGAALGYVPLGVCAHRRPGRRGLAAVHPRVENRRDHDSHRDQRCGSDDFHVDPLLPGALAQGSFGLKF